MLYIVLGVCLSSFHDIQSLLNLEVWAFKVVVLPTLLEGVVRDNTLDKGVNEMIDTAVPFAQ